MKITAPVILIVIILFLALTFKINFLSDDAFISFRYAENFAGGKGLVYNTGEKIEGYTNFLWVIIMSAVSKAGIDLLTAARAISILSAVLIIVLTHYISSSVFGLKGPVSFLSAYLVAVNPGFVLWTFSGMETLFFSMFVLSGLACVLIYTSNGSRRLLYVSSLMFLVASLTRPEGVLFFAASFLFLLVFNTQTSEKKLAGRFKILLIPTFIFTGIYLYYFFWRYGYYGQLLPNTFYAKTGFENQQLKGFYYCFKFVRESMAGGFMLIFPLYIIGKVFADVRVRFIFFVIITYCAYLVYIGGDNLLVQRFFVPVIALIFTLTALGVARIMAQLSAGTMLRILVAFFFILYPLTVLYDTRSFPMLGVESTMLHYENLKKAGVWLKENSLPEESIAVESAGIIPYFSGLKSYDRLGLNDPHISRHGKYGEGERDKTDEEYIKWTLRPDYLVDAFPTLNKQQKPDLERDSLIYKYNSVKIGKGTLEIATGVKQTGDLYFNYYKKTAP